MKLLWLQGTWSKWALASIVLALIFCMFALVVLFATRSADFELVSGFFALIASITCAQIALVETSYIQRNRASFWIVVVILLIGYFLFIFAAVASVGLMHTLLNWN